MAQREPGRYKRIKSDLININERFSNIRRKHENYINNKNQLPLSAQNFYFYFYKVSITGDERFRPVILTFI